MFIEGSQAITDWAEGSKILFVDQKKSGMIAFIEKKDPYKEMLFRCKGELKEGVEDYDSPGAKAVDGAAERYVLEPQDNSTLLVVSLSGGEMPADMLDYFRGVWPSALDKVKELAEA
ncbi:SRPBCC family protein [Mucilaginibacter pedocola]|uniref:hypothetical protein n=1 Tax=Mucilaginibacter pedocola TaxID=1792845 RepID=UPI000992BB80|nr:hypothetical protein [Mucilaginibacter pedocola]